MEEEEYIHCFIFTLYVHEEAKIVISQNIKSTNSEKFGVMKMWMAPVQTIWFVVLLSIKLHCLMTHCVVIYGSTCVDGLS